MTSFNPFLNPLLNFFPAEEIPQRRLIIKSLRSLASERNEKRAATARSLLNLVYTVAGQSVYPGWQLHKSAGRYQRLAEYYTGRFAATKDRNVVALYLMDDDGCFLGDVVITESDQPTWTDIPIAAIVKILDERRAKSFILIRYQPTNHFSVPENELHYTDELQETVNHLDIPIVDAIIIGNGKYFSLIKHDLIVH